MSAPSIILNRGQVLVSQTSSGLGIQIDNSPLLNGTIELVNDLTDLYEVGNLVLFNPQGAVILKYSGTDYFLTTEDNLFYKESIAP